MRFFENFSAMFRLLIGVAYLILSIILFIKGEKDRTLIHYSIGFMTMKALHDLIELHKTD